MKHTLCLLVLALMIANCKKDENHGMQLEKTFPGSMDRGKTEAKRDGKNWQASAFAKEYLQNGQSYIGITMHTFSEDGFNREILTIGEIPFGVGKYPVKGNNSMSSQGDGFVGSAYSWALDDGDVAGPVYDHDDNVPGFLELTFVDTVARKIAGKFDRMVFKNRDPESFYQQTVVFENGIFEMTIID